MDYEKLVTDLAEAKNAGIEAGKGEDGGSANLDCVFLRLPRARESKVLGAISQAGLFCGSKTQWIGPGYLLSPVGCGQ